MAAEPTRAAGGDASSADRADGTRRDDHVRIEHLAEALLPELAARLAAGSLGEIEIREDEWRLRVRRSATAAVPSRRNPDRGRAGAPGHAGGHAQGNAGPATGRSAAGQDAPGATFTTGSAAAQGATPQHLVAVGPGGHPDAADDPAPSRHVEAHRMVVHSPAIGIFQVRTEGRPGTRVRAGDRLAVVDLLGVPQDVVAPEDGVVVTLLVESGDGVEYGQELVVIERVAGLPSAPGATPSDAGLDTGSVTPAASAGPGPAGTSEVGG